MIGDATASEGILSTPSSDVLTDSAVGRVSQNEDHSHHLSEVAPYQGDLVVSDTQASSSRFGGKTIDDLADFEGLLDTNVKQERVAKFKPKTRVKLGKVASKSRKMDQKAVASTIDVASQSKDNNRAPRHQEYVHTSDYQPSMGISNIAVDKANHESILEEPAQEEAVTKIISESRRKLDVVSEDTRIDSHDEGHISDMRPKPRDQEATTVPYTWQPLDIDANIDLESQDDLINPHIDDTGQIIGEPSAIAEFQPNVGRKKVESKSVTFILPDASKGVAPAHTSSERSDINHYRNEVGTDESLNNSLEQTAQKHSLAEKQHSNDQEYTDRENQYHEGEPSDQAAKKQPGLDVRKLELSMKLRSRKKVLKVGISEVLQIIIVTTILKL